MTEAERSLIACWASRCLLARRLCRSRKRISNGRSRSSIQRIATPRSRFYVNPHGRQPSIIARHDVWVLGEVDSARERDRRGRRRRGRVRSRSRRRANAYFFKIIFDMVRGDAEAARNRCGEIVIQISEQHGLCALSCSWESCPPCGPAPSWDDSAGRPDPSLDRVLSSFLGQGTELLLRPSTRVCSPELEAKRGDVQDALTRVENALALASFDRRTLPATLCCTVSAAKFY